MGRLDEQRKTELEPKRLDYAIEKITELGYYIHIETNSMIGFFYKEKLVMFYPYTGWHTGKTITDGRGIEKLLKQIKND